MNQFRELFREAKKLDYPYTIHAGECGSVQNIIDAVDAGAARVGHGVAMKGFQEVQKLCRDHRYWRGDLPYQQSSDSRSLDFEGVSYQRASE